MWNKTPEPRTQTAACHGEAESEDGSAEEGQTPESRIQKPEFPLPDKTPKKQGAKDLNLLYTLHSTLYIRLFLPVIVVMVPTMTRSIARGPVKGEARHGKDHIHWYTIVKMVQAAA